MKIKEITADQPQITPKYQKRKKKKKTDKSSKRQIIIIRNDKKKFYRTTSKGQMKSYCSVLFYNDMGVFCLKKQSYLKKNFFRFK